VTGPHGAHDFHGTMPFGIERYAETVIEISEAPSVQLML
jgi:hypothetical protein